MGIEHVADAVRMILPLLRIHASTQEQMKLVLLVPDVSVSYLIGKKGASVQEIQSQSQTTLSFVKPHDMQSSRDHRALSIAGDLEQIVTAFVIILDSLEQFWTKATLEDSSSFHPPPPLPPGHAYPPPPPPVPRRRWIIEASHTPRNDPGLYEGTG